MELEDLKALQPKGISLFKLISSPVVPDAYEHGMAASYHAMATC